MKCEFVRDDNGTIWFVYAKEIIVRSNVEAILKRQKAIDSLLAVKEAAIAKYKEQLKQSKQRTN